jgi:rRNA maturation RNase YbeY
MKMEKQIGKSSCKFNDYEINSGLKQKRKLGIFIGELLLHYTQKESSLQYIFVSDDYLLDMNLKYLQHDTYTDIITFDLSEKKSNFIEGEIYISVDRVRENANTEGVSFQNELLRVILHGALHLCGFNDKTKAQKANMRELESTYLEKYLTA